MKVVTIADVPEELANAWLQHLRDFDTAHPGCHFEVLADAPDMPFADMIKTLEVNPSLTVLDVLRRKR